MSHKQAKGPLLTWTRRTIVKMASKRRAKRRKSPLYEYGVEGTNPCDNSDEHAGSKLDKFELVEVSKGSQWDVGPKYRKRTS